MMKQTILSFSKNFILALSILFIGLFFSSYNVNATSVSADTAISWVQGKVGSSIDTDGYPTDQPYQCVDLIKAYYQYLGVSASTGNGADYATNRLPSGWSRVQGGTPQKGDILVYSASSSNPYGHVAIYESDYVTYHQNFNGPYVEKITYRYNGLTNAYWGYIRPNWGDIADMGDFFYANIIRCDTWTSSGLDGCNVIAAHKAGESNGTVYWKFQKCTQCNDGSYIIYNCGRENYALDYQDGYAVVAGYYHPTSQHWFITGNQNGQYYLKNAWSGTMLTMPSTTTGARLSITAQSSNTASQYFSLYKWTNVAQAPSLSFKAGSSASNTVFTWSNATNCISYNLRIFQKNSSGNWESFKDVWNLQTTSYSITLPAGTYQAYVDGANDFSYAKSNTVNLTINPHVHSWNSNDTIDKAATCSQTGSKSIHCNGCSAIKNVTVISKLPHKWSRWSLTKSATVFSKGMYTSTCSSCHQKKTMAISKLTPKIKLSATKRTLKKQKSYTLIVSGLAKGDAVKSVKSQKTKIATVKKAGTNKYKITAKKIKGSTTITVLLKSGKKASCKVTVK